MSSGIVSQQFPLSERQGGQIENVSDRPDSSMSDAQAGLIGHVSSNTLQHHCGPSNEQIRLVQPVAHEGFKHTMASSNQVERVEPKTATSGLQSLFIHNHHMGEGMLMSSNAGDQKSSLLSKRKAEAEAMFNSPISPQSLVSNKRAQMGTFSSSPGSMQSPASSKKAGQVHLKSRQNLSASNKKIVRNESISSKTGLQHAQASRRTVQLESLPKARTETSEAVRSKMRESLAAALALACQTQVKAEYGKGTQNEARVTNQKPVASQPSEPRSVTRDNVPGISRDALSLKAPDSAENVDGSRRLATELHANAAVGETGVDYRRVQNIIVLPEDDISFSENFFAKDELLQGNGLTWVMDAGLATEANEVHNAGQAELANEQVGGDAGENMQSPETLAYKIEAELFKLHGGVNKKYREKGRSLLFNLKDRNNPELRERVMSGGISPERLCSMTAEELASKELSQWRIAKAEELAQMVVLPDSDVDIRRLVRKTHKGEYQVEVEQDDGTIMEVSAGTSLVQFQSKPKEAEAPNPSEAGDTKSKEEASRRKNSSENTDISDSLIIPADATDFMQGMMVDEFKDADFLPPIVSLDEFMESLNSEPPFENLPVEVEQKTTPPRDKENKEACDKSMASDSNSKYSVDTSSGKASMVVSKHAEDVVLQSSESPLVEKISSPGDACLAEQLWGGVLQLNISSMVAVVGVYRSGEKASTKEWASTLEVKGRVRLDAFEKFLQELPMSRSRAVMILQFALKDVSSENERTSLSEAVDSYALDDRLGYAEPAPGVELYLCPPSGRLFELLRNHLSKDRSEILNSTDNGLIGIVVWRKAHLSSAISPNASSHHHKHSLKKQQIASRRQPEKAANVNANLMAKPSMTHERPICKPGTMPPNEDDDDDIPPGFGPKATRDDDDLPEFSFSGNLNSSGPRLSNPQGPRMTRFTHPSRPADQMRELVHKYGQTGANVSSRSGVQYSDSSLGIEPWNDDEDDIPEWRPQAPQQPQSRLQNAMHSSVSLQSPRQAAATFSLPSHISDATQNIAPSMHQGGRWVQPPPGPFGTQPAAGQYYGAPAVRATQRGSTPRSRGF